MSTPVQLVKEALNQAVQYVNAGDSPTEALRKTARAHDLNPNFIQRVGEGLNVALHYKHFEKHAGVNAGKDIDFPIADIPAVISSMYETEKKASASVIHAGQLPDFNRMKSSISHQDGMDMLRKEASSSSPSPTGTQHTAPFVMQKLAAAVAQMEKFAEEARLQEKRAEEAYRSEFVNLVGYFRKMASYRDTFSQFESDCLASYGKDACAPLVDTIYKAAGLVEPRGTCDEGRKVITSTCKSAEVMGALLDKIQAYHEASSMNKEASEIAEQAKIDARGIQSTIVNEKLAFFGADKLLEGLAGKGFEAAMDAKKDSGSPFGGTDGKLANIERRMLLQELIATDPILRRVPPQKVVQAFEQILRLAPQVSREKDIVRALLRQMVNSSAVEPFVAGQLTNLDIDMMKRRLGASGKPATQK